MKKHLLVAAMSLTLVSFMSQAENTASDRNTTAENPNSTNSENNYQMNRGNNTDMNRGNNTESYKANSTDNSNEANKADNTGMNKRDRDDRTVTPMNQSNNKEDLEITQAIRKSLMKQELSTNAKNIKVITQNGDVTLRGPVNNKAELEKVTQLAKAVPGIKNLKNELEVK